MSDPSSLARNVSPSKRICVLDRGYGSYSPEEDVVRPAGYTLDVFRGDSGDVAGKIAFAQGAPGILIRWTAIDDAFLDALPDLKAAVRYGVGYELVDVAAATRHGVKVAIVNNYGNHSVSDHALTLMTACMRGLKGGIENYEATVGFPPRLDVKEFHECTLGIIGLGRIGGTLARKTQSLMKRVIAFDPYISDEKFRNDGAEKVDFDTLLAESDIISIHCLQTPETSGMVDWNAFQKMRRRPVIVNAARGPIINEQALLDALRDDLVHSAGLDVFSIEPVIGVPSLEPLRKHPRVIATAHCAYYSETALAAVQSGAARNLIALLRGETIPDCLNP